MFMEHKGDTQYRADAAIIHQNKLIYLFIEYPIIAVAASVAIQFHSSNGSTTE